MVEYQYSIVDPGTAMEGETEGNVNSRAKRKTMFRPDKELRGFFLMDYRNTEHYSH